MKNMIPKNVQGLYKKTDILMVQTLNINEK